ncbi:hypothetical protein [Paraburkholderia sediminicola]|uniref:hypothetical protein n=1 Tax=Paraburkholderia sediminicola TaxID=458836 RepID=UPI0038B95F1F
MCKDSMDVPAPTLRDMLTTAIEQAQTLTFSSRPVGLVEALQSADIDVWYEAGNALTELSKGLSAAVTRDERFLGDSVRMLRNGWGGGLGFYPNFLGSPLLLQALKTGSADAAIGWLQEIIETNVATGRTIQTLWGVPVKRAVDLTPQVRIVPIEELPDSEQKRHLLQRNFRSDPSALATMLEHLPLQSALVTDRSISPLLYDPNDGHPNENYIDTDNLLKEIALVLTVVGPRMAIPGLQWFEFDNPDFTIGHGYTTKILEVLPLRVNEDPPLDEDEAKQIVGAYLALSGKTRKLVRVALQRIGQAMRRHNVGDAAVELSTAFEALLGDEATQEMTHKVRVRSVRLIGGPDAIRRANAAVMKKAYDVRSKLVHTGTVDETATEALDGERVPVRQIIDRALLLCVELVKIIIRRGEIPDWSLFDITEQRE